ncbi:MAG: aminotransferase class V-fold PLP-dependent enzyme [Syntrophales bacterium]|jgi:cysteine desulfurase family protein|nr:aminotransferase class V-fold PLP-dependent enzyme [Syntrophales bacterium]
MGVYLDNAATSWPKPESVYRAVNRFMRWVGATPGRGGHQREEEAARIADKAREALTQLFNAPAQGGVAFTMNATQAINMALKGALKPGDHVVTSSVEHNAMWRPLKALERGGVSITAVPCAVDGTLAPADVAKAIRPETRMIAMQHASNVLGTIQPITEIGRIARARGVLFLVDAAQTAGACSIDMEAMHIDLLAFAGHKGLYGPHGTGGLVVRPGVTLETWIEGGSGTQSEPETMPEELPLRLEAGTQNAAGIAGLLAGVRFVLKEGVLNIREHEMALTAQLITALQDLPDLTLLGPADLNRRTAIVSVVIDEYVPDQLAVVLDQVFAVMTRAGLHCAPQAHRTAGTLEQGGALRFSPGFFNTEDEISAAADALHNIVIG